MRSVSHQRTLPKKLVHKWAIDEVFLTDYVARSATETTLGAVLPRAHGFYCEFPVQDRAPDLALLIEVCRQACFVVAHTQFDVALEGNTYQFLFQELTAEVADPVALGQARPVELVVEGRVERTWRRGSTTSALTWVFALRTAEAHLADVRIKMTWIDRVKWREMRDSMRRGRGLPRKADVAVPAKSRLAPEDVGRVNQENVVLDQVTERDGVLSARVLADIRHPVLFDHPIDHIYAMVQLEACRQLALFAESRRTGKQATELEMSSCTAVFVSVAEFDLPTELSATYLADGSVGIGLHQGEREVSRFTVSVKPT